MKPESNRATQQTGISPARQEQSTPLVRGFPTKQAAEYIGVSESYLKSARRKNNPQSLVAPRFTRLGTKCIYLREELDAFLTEATQAFYSE